MLNQPWGWRDLSANLSRKAMKLARQVSRVRWNTNVENSQCCLHRSVDVAVLGKKLKNCTQLKSVSFYAMEWFFKLC